MPRALAVGGLASVKPDRQGALGARLHQAAVMSGAFAALAILGVLLLPMALISAAGQIAEEGISRFTDRPER